MAEQRRPPTTPSWGLPLKQRWYSLKIRIIFGSVKPRYEITSVSARFGLISPIIIMTNILAIIGHLRTGRCHSEQHYHNNGAHAHT
jgi:hypothetical protein